MIKTLMKEIKQYKKDSILTIVFASIEVFMEILIPLLMAGLIDKGIEGKNMNEVIHYGILMLIIAIGTLSLGFLAGK